MLGVTLFGIFLTPVFFYVVRWLTDRPAPPAATHPANERVPGRDGAFKHRGAGV